MLVDKLNGLYKENILNTNINGELGLNGLIIGPVGSGKTASVDEWCSTLDKDVHIYDIFANTRPHMYEYDFGDEKRKILFGANEVEAFNKENTILVIDHFDLTDNEVRKELFSLINDREISSPYKDQKKIKVDKFWYAIAVAYPESHFGYDALSKQDKASFDYVFNSVEFYSNASTEEEYIEDVVNDIIRQLDDEDKEYYLHNPEYDHMFVGSWIRNEYLWNKRVPSDKDEDELSEVIFKRMIEKIKEEKNKYEQI